MDERKTGIDRSIIENETLTEADSVHFYLEEMQRMNNQLVDVQRELTRALSESEAAKKEKEQFYSAMSHDIRIQLNAIRGMTRMALDDVYNTESVKENLKIIQNSSEYVISIVTDILDIGKMDSNASPLEEVDFSLQEEIESIKIMMQSFFEDKQQIFICNIPKTPYYLYGSWKHVRRILTNLLSNAAKYTQDGGTIVLTVAVEQDEKYTLWTTFSVRDNGMGMTEEQRKCLFTPYFRTDRASVKMIQGTGLGLTIVKRFAELCNGTVEVTSRENHGSTFTVKIPFRQGAGQIENYEERLKEKVKGRHPCFLLCEDNQINAKIVKRLLEKYEIKMDYAENGQEGVELFQRYPQRYIGVFMDVHMPVMGGIEAAGLIHGMNAAIPIIALSGDKDVAVQKQLENSGMSASLEKPLDVKRFYEIVYHCIE